VATNAAIDHPEIEVGFESSPGLFERDYFQSYIPPESSITKPGRRISIESVVALLKSLQSHSEHERLLRACNQYGLALSNWKLGNENLSLAHLWMAVEALTTAVLRSEQAKRGLATPDELANALGIELKQLDGEVRRQLILKSDDECYRKGKDASDGFEHGFMSYDKIRAHATDVQRKMAQYVRQAIFELSNVDASISQKLLNDPFDRPVGNAPLTKYMRGQLVGNSPNLAKEGNAYPFLAWKPDFKSAKLLPDGKTFGVEFTETLTPELGPGISFRPKRSEIWQD
jgi:hypothetical protein